MSLSLRMCSNPTTCPENFEEGPQIFVCFIFFGIPLLIFSATSLTVEFFLRIIGSLDVMSKGL